MASLDTNKERPSNPFFGRKGDTHHDAAAAKTTITSPFSLLLSPLKNKLNDLNDRIDSDISRIGQSFMEYYSPLSPKTLLRPVKDKLGDFNMKVDMDLEKMSESVKKGWKENFKSGTELQHVVRRHRRRYCCCRSRCDGHGHRSRPCGSFNSHDSLELSLRFRGGYDYETGSSSSISSSTAPYLEGRRHQHAAALLHTNGTTSCTISNGEDSSFMDRVIGRDLSFAALGIVTLQSIHTLMKRNHISLLEEVRYFDTTEF